MKKILVVNAGSSSMKFMILKKEDLNPICNGLIERLYIDGKFTIEFNGEKKIIKKSLNSHGDAVKLLINQLIELKIIESLEEIKGIGHRVVQGGEIFKKSSLITNKNIHQIEELSKLAPLHNPGAASVIRAFFKLAPHAKNVAVFDTSYHQSIPKINYMYAVPKEWYDKYSIRKYGAHGISHKYMAEVGKVILNKDSVNIISCHLGNGASITAIKDGVSIDTSMGLTPLAGIVMGTRSGDIDPSIHEYISKVTGKNIIEITEILNKNSGVLGLSGVSPDFRDLEHAANKGNEDAQFAMELYSKKVAEFIVRYQNELENKVDAIFFTAGIGENASIIRELVMKNVHTMETKIDKKINNKKYKDSYKKLSTEDSKVHIYMVKTAEELMIAKDLVKVAKL